jgi:uncharacterized protein (DUF169 family)
MYAYVRKYIYNQGVIKSYFVMQKCFGIDVVDGKILTSKLVLKIEKNSKRKYHSFTPSRCNYMRE